MEAKIIKVTPEMAQQWLSNQPDDHRNRTVSNRFVEKFASDISDGRWQFNGQPIILNGKSVLDGQHRLMAIIKANKPVDMLVVKGIDHDVMPTIDNGHQRSAGNVAQILGMDNANERMAYARKLHQLISGSGVKMEILSTSKLLELSSKYEADIDRGLEIRKMAMKGKKSANWVAPFVFARRTSPARVDEMAIRFFGEAGLEKGSGMFALHKFSQSNIAKFYGQKHNSMDVPAYVFHAIRTELLQETMDFIRKPGHQGELSRLLFRKKWTE